MFLKVCSKSPQETADLVTSDGEILNGKLHFLCSVGEFIKEIDG